MTFQGGLRTKRRKLTGPRRCPGETANHTKYLQPYIGRHGRTVTLGRMTRRYMTGLVGQNPGHLCLVSNNHQQATGDIDISAQKREGIDLFII
jgi:hypothetical protein